MMEEKESSVGGCRCRSYTCIAPIDSPPSLPNSHCSTSQGRFQQPPPRRDQCEQVMARCQSRPNLVMRRRSSLMRSASSNSLRKAPRLQAGRSAIPRSSWALPGKASYRHLLRRGVLRGAPFSWLLKAASTAACSRSRGSLFHASTGKTQLPEVVSSRQFCPVVLGQLGGWIISNTQEQDEGSARFCRYSAPMIV